MASLNPEIIGNDKEIIVEPIVPRRTNDTKLKSSEIEKKVACESGNIMINLRDNFFAIKRVFEDQCLHYSRGENLETTRIYQVWPGKNVHTNTCIFARMLCFTKYFSLN